jgi:formamidopyrimidine-DNA glycosylase
MPEMPEVEAVCRRLRGEVVGRRITGARILRPSTTRPQKPHRVESQLRERRIDAISRRGKHILLELSGGSTAVIHLRMTGDLYTIPDGRFRSASVRALLELSDGRTLVFDDSRALGKLHVYSAARIESLLETLGPEPLSPRFSEECLAELLGASRRPVKLVLMDQERIAGLGNIYAAEALYRARIHPGRAAASVGKVRCSRLYAAINQVMEEAVAAAEIAYAVPGRFEAAEFPLQVYGHEGEPCHSCGRIIRRIPQGGRSTYSCPGCQR